MLRGTSVSGLGKTREDQGSPIRFIKNNNLMATGREGDLLLSKSLYPIPHDIDTCTTLSDWTLLAASPTGRMAHLSHH